MAEKKHPSVGGAGASSGEAVFKLLQRLVVLQGLLTEAKRVQERILVIDVTHQHRLVKTIRRERDDEIGRILASRHERILEAMSSETGLFKNWEALKGADEASLHAFAGAAMVPSLYGTLKLAPEEALANPLLQQCISMLRKARHQPSVGKDCDVLLRRLVDAIKEPEFMVRALDEANRERGKKGKVLKENLTSILAHYEWLLEVVQQLCVGKHGLARHEAVFSVFPEVRQRWEDDEFREGAPRGRDTEPQWFALAILAERTSIKPDPLRKLLVRARKIRESIYESQEAWHDVYREWGRCLEAEFNGWVNRGISERKQPD